MQTKRMTPMGSSLALDEIVAGDAIGNLSKGCCGIGGFPGEKRRIKG